MIARGGREVTICNSAGSGVKAALFVRGRRGVSSACGEWRRTVCERRSGMKSRALMRLLDDLPVVMVTISRVVRILLTLSSKNRGLRTERIYLQAARKRFGAG